MTDPKDGPTRLGLITPGQNEDALTEEIQFFEEGLAKTDELIRRGETQVAQLAAQVQTLRNDRAILARMLTRLRYNVVEVGHA